MTASRRSIQFSDGPRSGRPGGHISAGDLGAGCGFRDLPLGSILRQDHEVRLNDPEMDVAGLTESRPQPVSTVGNCADDEFHKAAASQMADGPFGSYSHSYAG